MQPPSFYQSVRFNVIAAISVMGLLGLAFALLTGERYKRLVFESEQQRQNEIVSLKVWDDLERHQQRVRQLSQTLQQSPALRAALRQQKTAELVQQLNNQFHQYMVTSGHLELLRLSIYDSDLRLIAQSSEVTRLPGDKPVCTHLMQHAAMRQGAARLKGVSDLCPDTEQALHADFVPIGGLRPLGYLLVLSNPVPSLIHIGEELRSPIEIRLPGGLIVGQSDDWSPPGILPEWAVAEHVVRNRGDVPILKVRLIKDTSALVGKLNATRATVMLAAIVMTVAAMLLAFVIMRRSLLAPLDQLTRKLQLIGKSRRHLGETVPLEGCNAIQTLAQGFNEMSTELADLYHRLEQQAFSDPLTLLPNRSWFHDNLERLRSLADREGGSFALLILDLNHFKPINDTLGHQVGDQVLKIVADRINAMLRGSDYLARADLVDHEHPPGDALARMGGDEFAILLPSTSKPEDAVQVAEKIMAAVVRPIETDIKAVHLGVSIGIAIYPRDADSTDQLIYHADLAMYDAKLKGTGYSCYSPSLRKSGKPED